MRIEINAGGLGRASVAQYELNMVGYVSDAESMISSFKAVSAATCNLNGGVGNLRDALNNVEERIRKEEQKLQNTKSVLKKTDDFLALAIRVDKEVAVLVNKNKDEFYRVNPWLRPVDRSESLWDRFCNWVGDKAKAFVDGLKKAWEWIKDAASKIWDSLVEFYEKYKKIIDTVLIVVGAVLAVVAVVASGGLALVPLLGALGVSTGAAIAISTAVAVVAVVSTIGSSVMNIIDIWFDIDNPIFNAFQKAFNIVSVVSNLTYAAGGIYNSIKGINPQDYIRTHSAQTPKTPYQSVDDLSRFEKQTITDYTKNSDIYDNMNGSLRGYDTATPENVKRIENLKNTLDNSSLNYNKPVYRGTSQEMLGDLRYATPEEMIGKPLVEKGFMSTSSSYEVSMRPEFLKDLHITIDNPMGAHALDVSKISAFTGEKEILFSAGQNMVITSAERVNNILKIHVTLMK